MKRKIIFAVLVAASVSVAKAMNRKIPFAHQVCSADAIASGRIVRIRPHFIKSTEGPVVYNYDEADLKIAKVFKGNLSSGKVYGIIYLSTDQPPRPFPPATDTGGSIERHVKGEEAIWFMRREPLTGNYFRGWHSDLQYDEDLSKAVSEAKCGK